MVRFAMVNHLPGSADFSRNTLPVWASHQSSGGRCDFHCEVLIARRGFQRLRVRKNPQSATFLGSSGKLSVSLW